MRSSSNSFSRARALLGTLVEIRIAGESADPAATIADAFAAIERVHRLMSAHRADSDVSRINRAKGGASVSVDPWTYNVLVRAKEINLATNGLFDCAIGSVLIELGHLPCHGMPPRGSRDASMSALELLPGAMVRVRRPLAICLDGIAKGYAVDRAVEALRCAGVSGGVVNAGGDLRLFGERAEPVHVRHPASPGTLICLGEIQNAAVASSAAYFSVSPLIDPRTRQISDSPCGVTVIAQDCMTADALTKPCLLSPGRAYDIAANFGARAMMVEPEAMLH